MADISQLLYVVDEKNHPVATLDAAQIHRQGLLHRNVYLQLRVKDDRLVLRKRGTDESLYPGRWDIVGCGHVPAGASAVETAEGFIPEAVRDSELPVVQLAGLSPAAGTDNEFIEIFQIRVPPRLTRFIEGNLQFMSVDRDELQSLVSNYPDLLTPALMTVWNAGIAF